MFTIVAAIVVLVAVIGSMAAIWRIRSQARIDVRLARYCTR